MAVERRAGGAEAPHVLRDRPSGESGPRVPRPVGDELPDLGHVPRPRGNAALREMLAPFRYVRRIACACTWARSCHVSPRKKRSRT